MNVENKTVQVDFFSEEEKEKTNKKRIVSEILEFARNSGIEISDDEVRVCKDGAERGNEYETSILFKVSERSAQLGYTAKHGINELEKRTSGIESLILKAVSYLQAAPEASQRCLNLARKVDDREIEWGDFEVPDADKDMNDERIAEEHRAREEEGLKKRKRAA